MTNCSVKKIWSFLIATCAAMVLLLPAVAFADDGGAAAAALPTWAILLIAVGIIVLTVAVIYVLLPKFLTYATKKGWDIGGFLTKAGLWIENTDKGVEALMKLGLPVNIVDTILDYAAAGVKYAEQLYHAGQLTGAERNDKAKEAIFCC